MFVLGENKIMTNKETKLKPNFKLHVMKPAISDDDITALFNGIVNVVKKKVELENNSQMIEMNLCHEMMMKELKEKKAEIVRLKNEILHLKSLLKNQ